MQQRWDESAAYYKWSEQKQREDQEFYAWMAWMGGWSTAASDSTPGQVPVARPVVILNPFALEKMAPADQEKVRQQATQSGQQILTEQQIVQNPFVARQSSTAVWRADAC